MSLPAPSVLLATRASVAVTTLFASLLASGSKSSDSIAIAAAHYTQSFGSLAAMVDPTGADAGAMANKHKRALAPLTKALIKAAAQLQQFATFLLTNEDATVSAVVAFERERRNFFATFDEREHRANIGYFSGDIAASLQQLASATDAFVATLAAELGGGAAAAVESALLAVESLIIQSALEPSPDIDLSLSPLLFDGAAHLAFQVARLRPAERSTNELLERSDRYSKIFNLY